jgi:hypothetical protein
MTGKPTEHQIQSAYIAWHRTQGYPGVVFAIPNGGARHALTGVTLKREGVLAGVPDVFYAWPSGGYGGLFLEFKTPRGRLSDAQKVIQEELRAAGYAVATVTSGPEAGRAVDSYLAITRAAPRDPSQ